MRRCNRCVIAYRLVQSVAVGSLLVRHSLALFTEIGSDLTPSRGARGGPARTSERILLQATAPCSSPVRKCTIDASSVDIQPSVYDAISKSQNCSTSFGGVLCGGYLLDAPLHAAIIAGACDVACEITQQQACLAPPTTLWAPAPAPGPACAPQSEPGCERWQYVCEGPVQYSFTARQYTILQSAGTCTADLDPSYCFAGRSIVEVAAYNAVKHATCQKKCLNGTPIQACPASLSAPTPGPGSSLAAPVQHAFTLPNGSLATAYQQGALPRGGLSSALQTGAPPQHPPEHVPEALSSEYAGGYGGYGRHGTYGGYGRSLRKPQPPPSGLAAQSLSEAQVVGSDSRYLLQLGPSGECSAPCGGGTREKSLACMDTVLGLPVEMTMCSLNSSTLGQLSEPCNSQQCSGCYWSAGVWGACSADCGNGSAQRAVHCLSGGRVVSPDLAACSTGCQPALKPQAEKTCAAAPCISHFWQTGPWSACANGKSTRAVQCIDSHGGNATNEECLKSGEIVPQAEELCSTQGCSRDSDCMGAGSCNNATATCKCAPGFAGSTCAISLGPCNGTAPHSSDALQATFCCSTGVVDKQGACCSSGVVSEEGTCCTGADATLDSSGTCCNGQLDACGACNGTSQVTDFTGSCCPAGQDAGGLCCPLPSTVDEFGVCGGTSNSGISVLDLKLLSNHTSGLLSPGSASYVSMQHNLAGAVAARLGVNSSHVMLRSINPARTPARRLRALSAQVHDNGDFPVHAVPFSMGGAMITPTVIPLGHPQVTGRRRVLAQSPAPAQQPASIGATVWLRPPYSSGSYASLASQLTMGNTSTIGSPVHIQGVQGLSKLGIRGNGKCEIGELPGPDNEGVPADCPLTYHSVPNGANGLPCSGHGAAIYAQGTCQCYTGYTGDACQACGNGYALASDLCQRTLESFQAQAALAGKPAQLPPSPGPGPRDLAVPKDSAASLAVPLAASLLGCLAVLALVTLVLALYVRHRRRRRGAASAQKKGEALPVTVSAGTQQQAAAQTGGAQDSATRPASHATDVTTSAISKPSKCWSFFSARSNSHTSAGRVAPTSQSESGSSVSSTSAESVRRRSAMGSMTFTHSTTHSHPSKTSMRPTYTVTHTHEAEGLVTATSGTTYYDAPSAPEHGAESDTLDKGKAKAFVNTDAGAKGDLHAHAVALSDCSEMSFGGAPMSAGSSQTCIPRTDSIPEEREVMQKYGKKKK